MTHSEYMAGIAACLEPQAVSAVRDAKTQIELSTALSLKRIADALTAEQIEQRRKDALEARMRHLEACDRASRARYGRPVGRPVDWMAA